MVTPRILIVDTRRMSGSDDSWVSWHFLFLSIITISADLLRLRVRLLAFAHSSMLSSSRVRLSTLIAGTMRYVSSAFICNLRLLLILCPMYSCVLTAFTIKRISMVGVFHKVQKFFSGTGSPSWSQKKGCKTVVVVVVVVRNAVLAL